MLRAIWMFGLLTYIGAYLRDDLGESTERVSLYYMAVGGYHAMALGLPIFVAALLVWPQRADTSAPMTARTG